MSFKKLVYKVRINDGPVQIFGEEEMDEDWYNEAVGTEDEETWLNNTGYDWAYEALHSDPLQIWAEFE